MAKKHKKKPKIKNFLILAIVIIFIIIIIPKGKNEEEVIVKKDLNTMTLDEIKAYGDENNIKVNTIYEYNIDVEKDKIISTKE